MDSENVIRCRGCLPTFSLLALLIVLGSTFFPQSTTAQSVWDHPFDQPSEQENTHPSPAGWGTSGYTNDSAASWEADDPWGTEQRWDTDNSWNTESSWADDFYGPPGNNGENTSNAPAERVGDGIAMNQSSCESRGNPNNQACVDACSSPNPPSTCNSACAIDPDGAACQAFRESCASNPNASSCRQSGFGSTGTGTPQDAPLPGVVYLLLVGLGYGGYRLREQQAV